MAHYGVAVGSSNVIAASLQTIANKESRYKDAILQNHALCKSAAARLGASYVGGGGGVSEMEHTLNMVANDDETSQNETAAWLKEQRERLKRLAEQNVENERLVQSFVAAATHLRDQVLHSCSSQQEDTKVVVLDFEEKIQSLVQENLKSNKSSQLPLEQETMYREVCSELGEKLAKPKRSRGGGDEDDDDIEVFRAAGSQVNSLKCPITGLFLEEPMKNKVCGHFYSKEAIMHHLQTKQRNRRTPNCPVAGCGNTVTLAQLEKDVMMETMVRREMRRQDQANQLRATQASVLESDEEQEM